MDGIRIWLSLKDRNYKKNQVFENGVTLHSRCRLTCVSFNFLIYHDRKEKQKMNKESSDEDDKDVKEIINKLKFGGLFDQFRKECLADVDTKPAYQNLRQRVEGYVARFLSRQAWSPRLNKNQLRDSLRRQINQSGMLANGVERIIEQVVNPKILQVIKPKIDDIICQHLGIDPKTRQEALEKSKNQQKQNMQCLMSINTTPPTSGKQQQHSEYSGPVPLMDSFNAFNQSPGMWPTQMSQQQSMMGDYQTMMNYPMAMALNQQQYQYGMPPQMFPFMQQTAWSNNFMYPPPQIGLPGQQFPNVPASSDGTPTQSQYGTPTVPGTPGSLSQSSTVAASPSVTMTPAAVETTTPPNPSLPPLPPSPSTPPPPGTEDIPIPLPMPKKDLTKSLKEAKSQSEVIEEEVVEEVSQEDMLEDIPLPPIMPPDKKMDSEEVIEETETVEMSEDQIVTTEDDSTQDSTTKRPYQFAWDREVDVDEMSEVTVSSVHTSDLSRSEFEDDESDLELSSDSDTSEKDVTEDVTTTSQDKASESDQEGPPDLTETEAETSMEVVSQDDAETAESLPSSQDEMPTLKPAGSDASAKIEPVPGQESQVVVSQEISPPKPRKLISLQYNYSDSDDEETREEKKARVAKEKEERYLKRLQRRAELEAKRKEREEEKARMKEERKKAKEKAKDETQKEDKGSEDNKEEKDSQDEEKLSQPSDSPEKKKRKTKAELKEELIKQKLEKKLALRRQRTRTRRYTSEEFESIFTDEKKQPFSSQSYSEVVVEEGTVEETVETDFIVSMTLDVATEEVTEQSTVVTEEIPPSPPTPTMDEKYEDSEEVSIPASEHSSCIPIYEVPTGTAISAINVSIPHTRAHTKNTDDTKSNSSGRPGTPLSDISDTSKSGSEQKGVKRKRQDSGTSRSEEKNSSKRYDTSDLYPPRHSFASNRRRASSPITTETSLSSRSDTNASQPEKYSKITGGPASPIIIDDKSSRASSPSCKPSPISSSSLSPDHSRSRSRSRSRHSRSRSRSRHSRSYSHSRSRSRSRSSRSSSSESSVDEFGRAKRKDRLPSPIEEPILSDSSSDSLSRKRRLRKSSSVEDIESDSSESHFSDSEYKRNQKRDKTPIEEVDFGEAERSRTPIDMVDFGEAARLAQRSLVGVDFGEAERMTRKSRGQFRGSFRGRGRGGWFNKQRQFMDDSSLMPGEIPGIPVTRSPPPGSPAKRYYGSDRSRSPVSHSLSPSLSDLEEPPIGVRTRMQRGASPTYARGMGMRPISPPPPPRHLTRSQRSFSPSPPPGSRGPYSPPLIRPQRSMSPSPPPMYGDERSLSLSPGRAFSPPMTRGQRPPSPLRRRQRSGSPPIMVGMHPSSPPIGRLQRSPSPPMTRGQRPVSPQRNRGQRPPSPPITRGGQRPPSPPMTRRQRPPSPPMTRGRPISPPATRGQRPPSPPMTRGQRPPSPPMTRGHRPPSPPMTRGQRPPSPPMTRGRPISPPATRGQRPPSPPMTQGQRPLSPPMTRGQRSTSPPVTRGQWSSLPPVTRGQRSRSPITARGGHQGAPLTRRSMQQQNVPMTNRLRHKPMPPNRYSPPPPQRDNRRIRPLSPPAKRGKK